MKTREIKFRAWNGKYMIDPTYGDWISFDGVPYTEASNKFDTPNIEIQKAKDYVLMQCTGRRDCNGKEMYESDVVKIHYFHEPGIPNVIGVVEWIRDGFSIRGHIGGSSIYSIDFKTGGHYGDTPAVEVIGDIYRNPELLNETVDRETKR